MIDVLGLYKNVRGDMGLPRNFVFFSRLKCVTWKIIFDTQIFLKKTQKSNLADGNR